MPIGKRGAMTTLDREKINGSIFLGKEFQIAERLNAIEVTSTGAQEVRFDDNEDLKFGTGSGTTDTTDYDVLMQFDATQLEMLPRSDDLCAFNIGDGTTDMDFKWFGGATTVYVDFNVGNARVQGEDVRFDLNTLSSTTGAGYPLSATNTRVLGVFGDDANAAIGSGTLMKAIEGRVCLNYTGGNREQEVAGVLGKIKSVAGTNRHNMCGVMGSYEVGTSLTVDGQATATDTWMQAAIIGRVGCGSAITTINSNARLAGVAAMSNTTSFAANSGVYAGFYAGKWGGTAGSLIDFDYALYAENVAHGYYIDADLATISGEEHGVSLVLTGTLSSGDGMVGGNFAVTTAGTAGAWVSGIYAKVTQGATKNVNGYISGAEFEVVNTAPNVSDWFVLVLNSNSSYMGSHTAYIALREYGSADIGRLFWAPEMAQGTNSDTAIFSTVASDSPCDRKIRVTIGSTDYWLMLTTEGPSVT